MKHYMPGIILELNLIDVGECILFRLGNEVHLGIVVQAGAGEKFILDLDFSEKDGTRRFHIYDGTTFQNEPIISLKEARIVPILDQDAIGTGVHGNHVMNRALYVTELGPIVYAGINQTVHKINLANGSVYKGDLAYQFHTKRWRVEIETGTGEFEILREISP